MSKLYAFRRSLHVISFHVAVLALCSAAIAASTTPASAKSHHHGAEHHARAHHAGHHLRHHASRHHGWRNYAHRHARHIARASRWERGVAQMQAHGFAGTYASLGSRVSYGATAEPSGYGSSFSSSVVAEARRYIGGNPTGRGSLWCARFMNMVLQRSGYRGTGSDMARSFASYGQRVSGPQVGAIAVMGRRGGGHVGVVSGFDAAGNPILVSGNYHNRVVEAPYPRGRIYAYVMPTS
jgi:uncharacterized protein (TIGR02594 family)